MCIHTPTGHCQSQPCVEVWWQQHFYASLFSMVRALGLLDQWFAVTVLLMFLAKHTPGQAHEATWCQVDTYCRCFKLSMRQLTKTLHLSANISLYKQRYFFVIYRNPKTTVQRTNKKVNNDPTLRIQNLSILTRQIKAFYQVRLCFLS